MYTGINTTDDMLAFGYEGAKVILGIENADCAGYPAMEEILQELTTEYLKRFSIRVNELLQEREYGPDTNYAFDLEDALVHGWTDDGEEFIPDQEQFQEVFIEAQDELDNSAWHTWRIEFRIW